MGFEVRVQGVDKRYGGGAGAVAALDGVSFDVRPGAAVAIQGPSGSGKSTLLQVIGAMERADAGSVLVDGREVTAMGDREQAAYRRRIGFVFQRIHLIGALSALDNVLAPLVPFKTDFDRVARARGLLAAVGLRDRERSLLGQLSGGEQQRVAIARALVGAPGLLLADEPTGNLDSSGTEEVVGLLMDLREEHRMTLLIATHDPEVAARCERVVILRDGRAIDEVALGDEGIEGGGLDRFIGLAGPD